MKVTETSISDILIREGKNMINFDEEVARFQPSLDIDQEEESIYNNDMTDLSDVIDTIINGTSKNSEQ